jgi:hypothetical protein
MSDKGQLQGDGIMSTPKPNTDGNAAEASSSRADSKTIMFGGQLVKVRPRREWEEEQRAQRAAFAKEKRAAANKTKRAFRRAARDRNNAEDAIEAACEYLWMYDSHTRVGGMLALVEEAPSYVFWPVFLSMWPICDNNWDYRGWLLDVITAQQDLAVFYYDEEQRAAWDSLPASVKVYRGSSRERAAGISWTTCLDVAEKFVRGHRGIVVPDPVIATAHIDKTRILALITERRESEVLINPRQMVIRKRPWRSAL